MAAIGKWLLSDAIDHFYSKGDEFIEKGAIKAGQQVILMTDNFKAAFNDSMNKTVDRLDETAQKALTKLHECVDIKFNGAEIKTLVSTLPAFFFDRSPKIEQIQGNIIDPLLGGSEALLTIIGYFPDISQRKPYLLINSKIDSEWISWRKIATATTGLFAGWVAYYYPEYRSRAVFGGAAGMLFFQKVWRTFRLDDGAVFANTTILTTLTFPIDKSCLSQSKSGISSTKASLMFPRAVTVRDQNPGVDEFHFRLVTLPPSPGTIILEGVLPQKNERQTLLRIEELRSSEVHKLKSQEKTITIIPPSGWKLDTKTLNIHEKQIRSSDNRYDLPKGTRKIHREDVSEDRIQLKASTKKEGHGRSGWVIYEISCEAVRCVPGPVEAHQSIPLSWGESVVRKVSGSFKVIFNSFDGKRIEIARTEYRNPYIEVVAGNGEVTIRAKHPSEIEI